jgi:hypothetical protein
VSVVLASFGLGSATVGKWVPNHKGLFFLFAIFFMSLSLFTAVREKMKTGKNTGLILFSIAMILSLLLLYYSQL